MMTDNVEEIKKKIVNVAETAKPCHYEAVNKGPDGSKVWYSVVVAPIIQNEKVAFLNIASRNITSIKESESAVVKAMIEGQDEERKRVSEELHDGLGQLLSSIGMNFNAIKSNFHDGESAKKEENINNVEHLISEAISEVRNISHNLMPDILDSFGLVPALEDMVRKIEHTQNLKVGLEIVNVKGRMERNVEIAIYRIAQELINNVVKHSNANSANIQLTKHKESVVLVVEDDGEGFDPKAKKEGIGLKNIASRTKMLDGEFMIDSSKERGTVVTVELPLQLKAV
jgi:signal transduction histidine kinase